MFKHDKFYILMKRISMLDFFKSILIKKDLFLNKSELEKNVSLAFQSIQENNIEKLNLLLSKTPLIVLFVVKHEKVAIKDSLIERAISIQNEPVLDLLLETLKKVMPQESKREKFLNFSYDPTCNGAAFMSLESPAIFFKVVSAGAKLKHIEQLQTFSNLALKTRESTQVAVSASVANTYNIKITENVQKCIQAYPLLLERKKLEENVSVYKEENIKKLAPIKKRNKI